METLQNPSVYDFSERPRFGPRLEHLLDGKDVNFVGVLAKPEPENNIQVQFNGSLFWFGGSLWHMPRVMDMTRMQKPGESDVTSWLSIQKVSITDGKPSIEVNTILRPADIRGDGEKEEMASKLREDLERKVTKLNNAFKVATSEKIQEMTQTLSQHVSSANEWIEQEWTIDEADRKDYKQKPEEEKVDDLMSRANSVLNEAEKAIRVLQLINIEDARVTILPDGTVVCEVTAERNGIPYPAEFTMKQVVSTDGTVGWKVDKTLKRLDHIKGKNALRHNANLSLYRADTDPQALIVLRQNEETDRWERVEGKDGKIVFRHIENFNTIEKTKLQARFEELERMIDADRRKDTGTPRTGEIILPKADTMTCGTVGDARFEIGDGSGIYGRLLHERATFYPHRIGKNPDGLSVYGTRLAAFRDDANGVPHLLYVDPKLLFTHEQVSSDAGKENSWKVPDKKKKAFYSTGGTTYGGVHLHSVTIDDNLSLLYALSINRLTPPYDNVPFEWIERPSEEELENAGSDGPWSEKSYSSFRAMDTIFSKDSPHGLM